MVYEGSGRLVNQPMSYHDSGVEVPAGQRAVRQLLGLLIVDPDEVVWVAGTSHHHLQRYRTIS